MSVLRSVGTRAPETPRWSGHLYDHPKEVGGGGDAWVLTTMSQGMASAHPHTITGAPMDRDTVFRSIWLAAHVFCPSARTARLHVAIRLGVWSAAGELPPPCLGTTRGVAKKQRRSFGMPFHRSKHKDYFCLRVTATRAVIDMEIGKNTDADTETGRDTSGGMAGTQAGTPPGGPRWDANS